MKDLRKPLGVVLVVSALMFGVSASSAEDTKEDQWDKHFAGHEMWLTSLDSGLAVSARESRPMLMAFYSRL